MAVSRHFEIRYRIHGQVKLFVQIDSQMTDTDAWYYACLHAGIGVLHYLSPPPEEIILLRHHAERSGLTDVSWQEQT
ncbi:DUF6555 family protein [Pseudomonas quasicaspiana]|uniref:DUF6555 family protein n=1 Tax=Pseudomonas quasicaspiana TaxID=2829821 RepID=UPI001E3E70B5|nr:DUF6555 family protein [Pseudomonas quasicaspiana]